MVLHVMAIQGNNILYIEICAINSSYLLCVMAVTPVF